MTDETKKLSRLMLAFCLAAALGSITAALLMGELYPLFLANSAIVFAMVIVLIEALARD